MAIALLAVIAACSPTTRPAEVLKARGLAQSGQIAEARQVLAEFERSASTDAERHLRLARAQVDSYEAAFTRVDAELKQALRTQTKAQVLALARQSLAAATEIDDRYLEQAYRTRMGQLDNLLAGLDRLLPGDPDPATTGRVVADDDDELSLHGAIADHILADAEALATAGSYKRALALLREMLPAMGSEAHRLREKLWAIEAQGLARIEDIKRQAGVLVAAGQAHKALALLSDSAAAFPDAGPLAGLGQARDELLRVLNPAPEKPVVVVHEAARPAESVAANRPADEGTERRRRRELATAAGMAFDKRRFAEASRIYREAAACSRGLHFERLYQGMAAEADLMLVAVRALARAVATDPTQFRDVSLGYGEKADLVAVTDEGLSARIGPETVQVPWQGVPDQAMAPLLARGAQTGEEMVGAAMASVRALDHKRAEGLLKRALQADASVKPSVDALLARIRGDSPGEAGYVVVGGEFVSARETARAELLAKVRKALPRAWSRHDDAERDAVVKELLELESTVLPLLVDELTAKRQQLLQSLSRSKAGASLKALRQLRVELDKRRDLARELIFDTDRYFYPYQPPAVSGERAKEYAAVQREVDRRVALVREIWDGRKAEATLSGSFGEEAQLLRWVVTKLEELGAVSPPEALDFIQARGRSDIRSFALDDKDGRRLERTQRILEENARATSSLVAAGKLLPAEADLVRVTNDYRVMMGVLPLRLDERLVRAAHGHCDEMNRLGYFSHFSPTPGRRTPAERMALEGYTRGGGENLAINQSAEAALAAWQRSSGHHRNLLSAAHADIGTGNVGRNWAQNFGAGDK